MHAHTLVKHIDAVTIVQYQQEYNLVPQKTQFALVGWMLTIIKNQDQPINICMDTCVHSKQFLFVVTFHAAITQFNEMPFKEGNA